ncbi:hypothetical protein VTL71DRAFT_15350 [Oculimacula yallundae]|uniref:Uncharacterized protein n=1 Tax=Oculimacula yallundae TaxID=86028 RepID=A0ABR4CH22_9HELO
MRITLKQISFSMPSWCWGLFALNLSGKFYRLLRLLELDAVFRQSMVSLTLQDYLHTPGQRLHEKTVKVFLFKRSNSNSEHKRLVEDIGKFYNITSSKQHQGIAVLDGLFNRRGTEDV